MHKLGTFGLENDKVILGAVGALVPKEMIIAPSHIYRVCGMCMTCLKISFYRKNCTLREKRTKIWPILRLGIAAVRNVVLTWADFYPTHVKEF